MVLKVWREDYDVIQIQDGELPSHRIQDRVNSSLVRFCCVLQSKRHPSKRVRAKVRCERRFFAVLLLNQDLRIP